MKTAVNRYTRLFGFALMLALACSFGTIASACSSGVRGEQDAGTDESNVKVAVVGISQEASEQLVGWLERNGFTVDLYVKEPVDVSKYDGMVLPGGIDIDPSLYGQEAHPKTQAEDAEGDRYQIGETKKFIDAGLPILGICRGCQIVNVTLGGTLHQHIKGRHHGYRDVDISDGSFLFESYGASVNAWHYHHQCIDVLGDGLFVTETDAADGRIEAIEHESLPIYGVQWHPEVDKMRGTGDLVAQAFKTVCAEERAKRESGQTALPKAA